MTLFHMAVGQHAAEPVEAVVGLIVTWAVGEVKRLSAALGSAAYDGGAARQTRLAAELGVWRGLSNLNRAGLTAGERSLLVIARSAGSVPGPST